MNLQDAPAGLSKFSPPELPKPLGPYSHIGVGRGVDIVAIAGQVSVDADGAFVAEGDIYGQAVQAYANLDRALGCVGLGLKDLIKCNAYVVGSDSIKEFMRARLDVYAHHFPEQDYPPITLLAVSGMAYPELLVEVEGIAVVKN